MTEAIEIWPGRPHPLGATYDGGGTNFSLFSEVADQVELCLFDDDGDEQRVPLDEVDASCWHGYLPRWRPASGTATGCTGRGRPRRGSAATRPSCCSTRTPRPSRARSMGPGVLRRTTSATRTRATTTTARPYVPKSVVHNPYFDWGNDRPPGHPAARVGHLRDARQGVHRAPPRRPRGAARHLRRAGPPGGHRAPRASSASPRSSSCRCTSSCTTPTCIERGLRNYWGYNSIGFFAPHNDYASSGQRGEQVARVQGDGPGAARGRHRGDPRRGLQPHRRGQPPRARRCRSKASTTPPTTGWCPDEPQFYYDTTGTGNSLNVGHPHTLQLIMDSLRYWVTEMHVDGFRFDLAASLARELHEVDRLSAFFDLIQQDPVVSQVKLIAEPWDVGEGGYQVGNFPPCGRSGTASTATRSATSGAASRPPWASSPPASPAAPTSTRAAAGTRRPASTSSPRTTASRCATWSPTTRSTTRPTARTTTTATDDNRSWNCGVEGETDDPEVLALRRPPAAQLPGHAVPVAGRPDAAGRRRAGPDPARQQQRLLPGQRDLLARLGSRRRAPARLHPAADRAAPRPPGVAPPPVVPGPADPRAPSTSAGSSRTAPR